MRVTRRFILPAMVLGLLAVPLSAQRDITREYREGCDRLVCQCGCNEQLSVCAMQNCSSATPMRAEIRDRLQKGESVEQIVQSFEARMGKKVLSAPSMQGFDLTAWVMPFIMLCLGAVVLGWIVVRMVRPLSEPEPGEPPVAVDPRVEQELRDFEQES